MKAVAAASAQDPTQALLALIVVTFTLGGLAVSLGYSIPYAMRRVRRYPERGSAYRLFAQFTLFSVATPAFSLALFFFVGIIALVMDDTATRVIILRSLLVTGIVSLCAQVVIVPVWNRKIEDAASRERAQALAEEQTGVVSGRLDEAARQAEDRFAEGELEKREVRDRVDIQQADVARGLAGLEEQQRAALARLDEIVALLMRER